MARMCPECNSTRLTKEGWKKLKDGNKQRWRCKACNHGPFYKPKWTRGKKKDDSAQLIVDASGSWSDNSKWGKSTVKGKNVSKQPVNGDTLVLDDESVD